MTLVSVGREWAVWASLLFASCTAWAQAVGGLPSNNVPWVAAAVDADIDRAFAQARTEQRPLLLYWGATWCPPCNQLKATLFSQQEFALLTRSMLLVHVDGDRPGAQKLGARFQVRGYPTMIVLNPQGQELTRLPGEVEPEQVYGLLQTALAGGRPIQRLLTDARAGKALTRNEWRTIAFYSWETDEGRLVAAAERAALLAELADRLQLTLPLEVETVNRFWLKALATAGDGAGAAVGAGATGQAAGGLRRSDESMRGRVQRLLGDPQQVRAQMDVLTGGASAIVKMLATDDPVDRQQWVLRMDQALAGLQRDTSLSRADRVSALVERVGLARLDQPKDTVRPKIPEALVKTVREEAKRFDQDTTNGYERQAVITALAYLTAQSGLLEESSELLKANLTRSHSPYYLMSQLASNARKQGRSDEALRWYQEAFETSVGPATRLQWGAAYVAALIELSPADAERIEAIVRRLYTEAGQDSSAFHERSARSLQRISAKLKDWNRDGSRSAAVGRLRSQLDATCRRLPTGYPQKGQCEALAQSA
jgi:hypothetical protein